MLIIAETHDSLWKGYVDVAVSSAASMLEWSPEP